MNADRLLLYKVDKDTADVISAKYGTSFEILDVSDCFMDLMVLQARAILVDPDELYDQEIDLLADVFAGETEKEVYFTSQPAYPELLKDVTWKLFPYTQKKEVKPVVARKYSNRRMEEMLEDVKQNGDRFYVNGILNYKGKSAEGDYYTEVVSQWLLNKPVSELERLFLAGAEIFDEKEWPERPIHAKDDIVFSENTNRDEENIAKKLMLQGKIGDYAIVDYQVPVNRATYKAKDGKAYPSRNGKVDLILSKDGNIILGELKDADSEESFLRAVVEIATYHKKIENNQIINKRFKACYSGSGAFVPAVILFEGSRPYSDYCSDEMPNVRALAEKLGVKVIEIGPAVKGRENIMNTEFFFK